MSREKKAALEEKLELLRSATKSDAVNKTSILVDASKYIMELKKKVDAACSSRDDVAQDSTMPRVTVSTLEKGFLIDVLMEKSWPGLLVSVLEAFEELGLEVLDASVACAETFRLEAVGADSQIESVDAQMVRHAVLQAIKKCMDADD